MNMETIKYDKPSDDFAEMKFGDERLTKRLQKTVESMTQRTQDSVLCACGSRHDAKAFYALLSNNKFSYTGLVAAAHNATIQRIKSSGETEILLPQDTTFPNKGMW